MTQTQTKQANWNNEQGRMAAVNAPKKQAAMYLITSPGMIDMFDGINIDAADTAVAWEQGQGLIYDMDWAESMREMGRRVYVRTTPQFTARPL